MSNKYEVLIKNARVNAECGEHMSPTEVTTLLNVVETTFAALAAENARLKSIQEWAVSGVFKSGAKVFESTKASGFDTDDCLHDAVLVMLSELKTPETDAFLAEVRAQGVDALVERRLTAARLAKEAGHEITARDLEGEAIRARFFAMEIRKGVHS